MPQSDRSISTAYALPRMARCLLLIIIFIDSIIFRVRYLFELANSYAYFRSLCSP
jgi:hypothetical protein